jgi:hypothetical protein
MATEMQPAPRQRAARAAAWAGVCLAPSAHAAFLHGEALDTAADVIAWVALVIGPIVAVALFWIVHIMPEKVAHKRNHPQTEAIHMLCLLSLVFGGLLWPFALLWAVTRPVFHKMAYGTEKGDGHDALDGVGAEKVPERQEPTESEATV